MTLKRRFLLRNAVLVVMLLLLGAASIWGLWGLRQQVDLGLYEYSNLQTIESAEASTSKSQSLLNAEPADVPGAISQLQLAERLARSFGGSDTDTDGPQIYDRQKRMSDFTAARSEDAVAKLQDSLGDATPAPNTLKQVRGTIEAMIGDMHSIASDCHQFIQTAQIHGDPAITRDDVDDGRPFACRRAWGNAGEPLAISPGAFAAPEASRV